MLTYKNHMKSLVLPEYGRNIQNMVDHCLTIENREERTRCARSIVDAMAILFPVQGDQQAYRRKLWDHIALISDFKLDVDLPFELLKPEALDESPQPVAKGSTTIRRRQYGHLVEEMVVRACAMEPGEERDAFIELLANHMKKLQLNANPEGVEDVKVFKDLYEMSDGVIEIYPEDLSLQDYALAPSPSKKKRKK